MCPAVFARLDALYGPHEADLFATCLDTHCTRFYAYPASPGCDGIDAFRQTWSAGNLYANPPFSKIPLVLSKIVTDAATVTLVLPVWQDQDWWPTALARAHEAAVFRILRGGRQLPTPGVPTNAAYSSTPPTKTALQPLPSPTCATSL